jgi:hypothetical protein
VSITPEEFRRAKELYDALVRDRDVAAGALKEHRRGVRRAHGAKTLAALRAMLRRAERAEAEAEEKLRPLLTEIEGEYRKRKGGRDGE